jgi:putative membrane protein
MSLLLRWIINAAALLLIASMVPGIRISSFYSALIVALVLGVMNALVRPILIFLTLPITILTLGLFTLVINALLFWFVSSLVKGFEVTGFSPAFWGALILWAVSWVTNALLKSDV